VNTSLDRVFVGDDDVNENVHDDVTAHFFRQDKLSLDHVNDADDESLEDGAVL